MICDTKKLIDGVEFGIELEREDVDSNKYEVVSAFTRSLKSRKVKALKIMPFTLHIPFKTDDPDRNRVMFFNEIANWEEVYAKVQSCAYDKKPVKADSATKKRAHGEVVEDEVQKNLSAIHWFSENLKKDHVYQEESKLSGDRGLREAARLYIKGNPDKFPDADGLPIEPKTVDLVFNILPFLNIPSVLRKCRKAAEMDERYKVGIFPYQVHERRKSDSNTKSEVEVETSRRIDDADGFTPEGAPLPL